MMIKKKPTLGVGINLMARLRRLERLTHSLEGCCSIQLSYKRMSATNILNNYHYFCKFLCNLLYNSMATSLGRSWHNSSIVASFNKEISG